jgi:type I restriction enzyme S subunit
MQEMAFNQDIKAIIPDAAIIDKNFLAYWLLAFKPYLMGLVDSASHGTGRINTDVLKSTLISFPSISEQKAIAHILGTLDDKIELNQQMNRTLEGIARAIFKSWFIDFDPVRAKMDGRQPAGMDAETAALFPDEFEDSPLGKIPKGWEVGILGDIADNPRRSIHPENIKPETPYIGLEHMPRQSIALYNWGVAADVNSNKYEFNQGEILFGKLRPYFHKVGVAVLNGVCSTDILVIKPKNPLYFGFVLANVSSQDFVNYTDITSTGTRMPRANWKDMSLYKSIIPPAKISEIYNKLVVFTTQRIRSNIFEFQALSSIRDTLLPKLLSGEIRIKDAEKVLEEVT